MFAVSILRPPGALANSTESRGSGKRLQASAYVNRTKSAESGGLEKSGRRERISDPDATPQSGGLCTKRVVIGLLRALGSSRERSAG